MRVVNAGSIGMPFGAAGAYWLLLGPDVQLRHTVVRSRQGRCRDQRDRGSTRRAARKASPANTILQPPPEPQMDWTTTVPRNRRQLNSA